MIWYRLTTEEIYTHLETSDLGLLNQEVLERQKEFGLNQLKDKKSSLWRVIIEPFKSIFVGVLFVAAAFSLLSHELLDAFIITIIVFINTIIFYSQQYATHRVLRSLKKHSVQHVKVIRGGKHLSISSELLVPGDIIVISEGERIPADARITHTDNLQLDESSLTGESAPIHKHASTLKSIKQLYEQDNMVFQGTFVITGMAKAVVVVTGIRTEFGKIADLSMEKQTKSPVQSKIDELISKLIKAIGILSIIVFILSQVRGIPTAESLRFVLALSVSAVPEGLPVALTVIIVLGMRRMAKQQALVRSFKAIEDIGLVTTIATDKTGTLTKNILSVVDSWSLNKAEVLKIASLTLDPALPASDPLDQAIIKELPTKSEHTVGKLYTFDLASRMSGAYVKKQHMIYVKGAPEHILVKSNLTIQQHHSAESAMHEMTSNGYRVIAIGSYKLNSPPPENLNAIKDGITFIGFLAFADELRPEALPAIQAAKKAGINVRLITGDHFETAFNIGKQLGLSNHLDQVIKGTDLPKDQHALALAIRTKTIFARIVPADKFKILKALKQTEITAMTGDGVNDVPALTNAHVGIAMGSGSDIARDASGIVLLDDNFASIIKAISESRKIYDNIRRMLFYLLSTSLGEVLTMIGALLLGLPLPVTAIQILWINLVTDTSMVLPLGLEPVEDGHMQRPPRKPSEPILSEVLLSRVVIVALAMAVVTLTVVANLKRQGHSTNYIQTVAFMTLIAAQWMNAFNARSEYQSYFERLKKVNYGLLISFAITASLQALVMFGPLGSIFNIQPIPIKVLAIYSFIIVVAILGVSEIHKIFARRIFLKSK